MRLALAILCLSSCTQLTLAEISSDDVSNELERSLAESKAISFYFVSRTGNYEFSREEFKSEATIHVWRNCGNNCANFMASVIKHLREARKVTCQEGQQSTLIEISSGNYIFYSYSGRQIKISGRCFLSEVRIESIVKDREFLFR